MKLITRKQAQEILGYPDTKTGITQTHYRLMREGIPIVKQVNDNGRIKNLYDGDKVRKLAKRLKK